MKMNLEGLKPVELWGIHGVDGEYFSTKMAAEVRARKAFPMESADQRYARIYFKEVYYTTELFYRNSIKTGT